MLSVGRPNRLGSMPGIQHAWPPWQTELSMLKVSKPGTPSRLSGEAARKSEEEIRDEKGQRDRNEEQRDREEETK
jgi:hypothetical protein